VDANLDKLGKRFMWGHMAEDAYCAEWGRLTARKAELVATQDVPVDTAIFPLGSLMEGWNSDDKRTRRDLLATFFDELTVLDGQIFEVVPRKDREAQVAELLEQAFKGIVGVAPAGFEPAISALRGLRPSPLDDGATCLVGGVGVEPTTSRV
jgi:hypothetical protein